MRTMCALLVASVFVLGNCGRNTGVEGAATSRPLAPPSDQDVAAEALATWGIEPIGPLWSAGGYMLDFRFRVIDPAKAAPLLEDGVPRYLVHDATGARARVPSSPKTGPLRQTTATPEAGDIYYVIFTNPAGRARQGDTVTVVIGECVLSGLTIH